MSGGRRFLRVKTRRAAGWSEGAGRRKVSNKQHVHIQRRKAKTNLMKNNDKSKMLCFIRCHSAIVFRAQQHSISKQMLRAIVPSSESPFVIQL